MITIQQARKYLPPEVEVTDEELSSILADAYLVANLAVTDFLKGKVVKKKSDDK